MTRVLSVPTTIVVNPSMTALAQAAAAAPSNAFTQFHGGGLNTQIRHPYPREGTTYMCDVTQDGQAYEHTILDWCGKGSYDPINRRVQFFGHGTGSGAGQWRWNMLPYYDEATDLWSAIRSFRHSDQQTNDNALSMTHIYDNNCIDIAGRRLYKKQFLNDNDSFSSGKWFVFNLDTWQLMPSMSPASGDVGGTAFGPADFIPTRGKAGRIWYANHNPVRIWEYDVTTGTGIGANWTVILPAGSFPALNFNPANNGGAMSYNPRALGGQGAVLIGGGSTATYVVNCVTLQVTTVAPAPIIVWPPYHGRLCKEPNGAGWLLFLPTSAGGHVWRCDGTQWTRRAAAPPAFYGIVIPIDNYGVVWCISTRPWSNVETTPRAWLYKP